MLVWGNMIFYAADLSGDGVADQPSDVISAAEAEARTLLIAQALASRSKAGAVILCPRRF